MNFIRAFSNGIIKWWRVVVTKVLKVDNNPGHTVIRELTPEQAAKEQAEEKEAKEQQWREKSRGGSDKSSGPGFAGNEKLPKDTPEDALEVLNRINREKEEKRRREIEEERKKQEENARIASIMKAGKVDVNVFIEEGRSMAAGKAASGTAEAAGEAENKASGATDEQLRRAQEIMDRLNREAAEDEAKKQAEIDAAKAAAHEAGLS